MQYFFYGLIIGFIPLVILGGKFIMFNLKNRKKTIMYKQNILLDGEEYEGDHIIEGEYKDFFIGLCSKKHSFNQTYYWAVEESGEDLQDIYDSVSEYKKFRIIRISLPCLKSK